MSPLTAKRFIIRIELSGPAKELLAKTARSHGMTQVAVQSRIMEWFSNQPEEIQAAVLGRYPKEIEPDVARIILEKMGKSVA